MAEHPKEHTDGKKGGNGGGCAESEEKGCIQLSWTLDWERKRLTRTHSGYVPNQETAGGRDLSQRPDYILKFIKLRPACFRLIFFFPRLSVFLWKIWKWYGPGNHLQNRMHLGYLWSPAWSEWEDYTERHINKSAVRGTLLSPLLSSIFFLSLLYLITHSTKLKIKLLAFILSGFLHASPFDYSLSIWFMFLLFFLCFHHL